MPFLFEILMKSLSEFHEHDNLFQKINLLLVIVFEKIENLRDASQRRHRKGFWRDRRVYRQDVGGGGLLGRSPLALSCFLNTGRRGALLSHVFFSRFFSRSLLESASRRGALHSSLCSQLRRSLCSKLRSPQCRVLRSGVFAVQKKKKKKNSSELLQKSTYVNNTRE